MNLWTRTSGAKPPKKNGDDTLLDLIMAITPVLGIGVIMLIEGMEPEWWRKRSEVFRAAVLGLIAAAATYRASKATDAKRKHRLQMLAHGTAVLSSVHGIRAGRDAFFKTQDAAAQAGLGDLGTEQMELMQEAITAELRDVKADLAELAGGRSLGALALDHLPADIADIDREEMAHALAGLGDALDGLDLEGVDGLDLEVDGLDLEGVDGLDLEDH